MDKPTKDCVKYLKKMIKLAEKGKIIITIMNTDVHYSCSTNTSDGYKDNGLRHTQIEWRDLGV